MTVIELIKMLTDINQPDCEVKMIDYYIYEIGSEEDDELTPVTGCEYAGGKNIVVLTNEDLS